MSRFRRPWAVVAESVAMHSIWRRSLRRHQVECTLRAPLCARIGRLKRFRFPLSSPPIIADTSSFVCALTMTLNRTRFRTVLTGSFHTFLGVKGSLIGPWSHGSLKFRTNIKLMLFQRYLLIVLGSGSRYYLPTTVSQTFNVQLQLPMGVTCSQCIIQVTSSVNGSLLQSCSKWLLGLILRLVDLHDR
jgi:hypothetical protein